MALLEGMSEKTATAAVDEAAKRLAPVVAQLPDQLAKAVAALFTGKKVTITVTLEDK